MAALGWLLNLDFAAGTAEVPVVSGGARNQNQASSRRYRYGYGYRYIWGVLCF